MFVIVFFVVFVRVCFLCLCVCLCVCVYRCLAPFNEVLSSSLQQASIIVLCLRAMCLSNCMLSPIANVVLPLAAPAVASSMRTSASSGALQASPPDAVSMATDVAAHNTEQPSAGADEPGMCVFLMCVCY